MAVIGLAGYVIVDHSLHGPDPGPIMRGAKPHLKKTLDALDKAPPVPRWLPKFAKAEWRRAAPALAQRGILTRDNLASLENYCVAVADIRKMQAVLDDEGDFVTSKDGVPRPHPAHRIRRDAMTAARQLGAELGLTPVSRSRPSMAPAGGDDDWAGLVDE